MQLINIKFIVMTSINITLAVIHRYTWVFPLFAKTVILNLSLYILSN